MKRLIAVLLLGVMLASCSGATGTPTPVSPTDTPVAPTQTEVPPTLTPTVTNTLVPDGPCDNLLMGLNLGNRWVYDVTSEGKTSRHRLTVVERDDKNGINMVIEMVNESTGATSRDMVTCEDGAIEDFPIFFLSIMLADYLDGVFNTYYEEGIYSPAYSEFVTNAWKLDWQAQYQTEDDITLSQGGSNLKVLRDSDFDLYFHTTGAYEPVTVTAGTFPKALVVAHEFVIPVTSKLPGGISVAGILTVRMTQWYEPFMGLVRAQIDNAGVSFVPGQENTVLVDSVVELVEFIPGP